MDWKDVEAYAQALMDSTEDKPEPNVLNALASFLLKRDERVRGSADRVETDEFLQQIIEQNSKKRIRKPKEVVAPS